MRNRASTGIQICVIGKSRSATSVHSCINIGNPTSINICMKTKYSLISVLTAVLLNVTVNNIGRSTIVFVLILVLALVFITTSINPSMDVGIHIGLVYMCVIFFRISASMYHSTRIRTNTHICIGTITCIRISIGGPRSLVSCMDPTNLPIFLGPPTYHPTKILTRWNLENHQYSEPHLHCQLSTGRVDRAKYIGRV